MGEDERKSEGILFGFIVLLFLAICLCFFFVLIFCFILWGKSENYFSSVEENYSYTLIYHDSKNKGNSEVSYFSSNKKIRNADSHGHVFWDEKGTGTIHTTNWKNDDRELRLEGDCYCCRMDEECNFEKREVMFFFTSDPISGKRYGSKIIKDRCQRICLENIASQSTLRSAFSSREYTYEYAMVQNVSVFETDHEEEKLSYYLCEGYCSPDPQFVDFIENLIPAYDNNLKRYFKNVGIAIRKYCNKKNTIAAFMMSRDACPLELSDVKLKFEDKVLYSYCTQFTFEEAAAETDLSPTHLEEVYGILSSTTFVCYPNAKSTICDFEDDETS